MGLMDALYLGVSGLKTSQNAMNTTAHNIANAETPGFVRQQTVLTDFGSIISVETRYLHGRRVWV